MKNWYSYSKYMSSTGFLQVSKVYHVYEWERPGGYGKELMMTMHLQHWKCAMGIEDSDQESLGESTASAHWIQLIQISGRNQAQYLRVGSLR